MIQIGGEDFSKHLPDHTNIMYRDRNTGEWKTSEVIDDRVYIQYTDNGGIENVIHNTMLKSNKCIYYQIDKFGLNAGTHYAYCDVRTSSVEILENILYKLKYINARVKLEK